MFDPNKDDLYGGLANVRLLQGSFQLGQGVGLEPTYGHLFSTMMMAFSPAPKGKPSPGPWAAVAAGYSIDVHVQVYIPNTFSQVEWFDRLNTVWWITALARLRVSSSIIVPVISDRPFSAVPVDWAKAKLIAIEAAEKHMLISEKLETEFTSEDLEWLRDNWIRGGRLMRSSSAFNAVFQAYDFSVKAGSYALGLIAIWGALEEMFAHSRSELRFRVAASIASFLEPPGNHRLALHS